MCEAVISASWPLVGKSVRDADFRARYQAAVVAIHRAGERVEGKLGQIRLESEKEWTPDQQSLVDAVATQAALALENARLVSESRQIALRERMVAEINSKIWASATIDGVLQTTIKELGRRLNASSATIELSIEDLKEEA